MISIAEVTIAGTLVAVVILGVSDKRARLSIVPETEIALPVEPRRTSLTRLITGLLPAAVSLTITLFGVTSVLRVVITLLLFGSR